MSRTSADLNLLFGMIALQTDFISRDALLAALNAWVVEKPKELGNILVELGALTTNDLAVIQPLVQRHIERHDYQAGQSLQSLAIPAELKARLLDLGDEELTATLQGLSVTQDELADAPERGAGTTSVVVEPEPLVNGEETTAPATDDSAAPRAVGLRERFLGMVQTPRVPPSAAILRPLRAASAVRASHASASTAGTYRAKGVSQPQGTETNGADPASSPSTNSEPASESTLDPYNASRVEEAPSGPEPAVFSTAPPIEPAAEHWPELHLEGWESLTLEAAMARVHEETTPPRSARRQLRDLQTLVDWFRTSCEFLTPAPPTGRSTSSTEPTAVASNSSSSAASNVTSAEVAPGIALAVDWGSSRTSASQVQSQELGPPPVLVFPPDFDPDAKALTVLIANALGTPPYMCPERAAGRLDLIGPPSHVYSLGAALSCVLTGSPPYDGRDEAAVRRQILQGSLLTPKERNPLIPSDLERICLKAMARSPEDRHPSIQVFLNALNGWLTSTRANETASAAQLAEPPFSRSAALKSEPRLVFGSRPRLTSLKTRLANLTTAQPGSPRNLGRIAAAGLLGVLVLGAGWQVLTRLSRGAGRAETSSLASREDAKSASDALAQTLAKISASTAFRDPNLAPVRAEVLADGRKFYEDYIARHKDDPSMSLEVGRAYFSLADLTAQTDSQAKAIGYGQQAQAIFTKLSREHPDEHLYQEHLASGYHNLGVLYDSVGRPEDAERAFKQGISILESLARRSPDVLSYQLGLASSYSNLGLYHAEAGRLSRAEEAYQKAMEYRKALVREHPKEVQYQEDLAQAQKLLADLYWKSGRRGPAELSYQEALAAWRQLGAQAGARPEQRLALAEAHRALGRFYFENGRIEEAQSSLKSALEILQSLVEESPKSPLPQSRLAAVRYEMGTLDRELGRDTSAEELLNQAMVSLRALVNQRPDDLVDRLLLAKVELCLAQLQQASSRPQPAEESYRNALTLAQAVVAGKQPEAAFVAGTALQGLGGLLASQGKMAPAEDSYKQGQQQLSQLVRDYPEDVAYQGALAESFNSLAALQAALGKSAESEESRRQALVLLLQLARNHPETLDYQTRLATTRFKLADLYVHLKRHSEAEPLYSQALEVLDSLTREHPERIGFRNSLGITQAGYALLLSETQRAADAEKLFRETLRVQEPLAQEHPELAEYQSNLALTYSNFANLMVGQKRHSEAVDLFKQSIALQQSLVKANPNQIAYAIELGKVFGTVGRYLSDQSQSRNAGLWYDQAVAILAGVLERQPNHTLAKSLLRNAYWGRALALGAQNQHDAALADWEKAIQLDDGQFRPTFLLYRASSLARKGEHARAAEGMDEVLTTAAQNAGMLHNAAWLYCLCSTQARNDANLAATERARVADQYATRAVELIAKAQAAGFYKQPANLKLLEFRDFDPLRNREDFKTLIAQLGESASPETTRQ